MSNEKPIYLLAGGRGGSAESTNTILRIIFEYFHNASPTIAYVGAANEDSWVFFKLIAGMIKKAVDCKITRVLLCSKGANIQKAQNILNSADAVFMSGGDVEMGMQVLEAKNIIEFLRKLYQQGKLFFGTSAGSIMLAREWVRWKDPDDDSTAELFPCLGLVPVICDTHAEGDDWEELQAALRLEVKYIIGYGIATGTCLKVFPNGEVAALGGAISQYVRRNEKVERQLDLLPVEK